LVSNDDGIAAEGIMAIVKELVKQNKFDVRVAAPVEEQSAKSHSITLRGLLEVEKLTLPEPLTDVVAWKITGSPADCVKVALNTNLWDNWVPDLVVSGINRGGNTGLSVHYSGTVAAAREANFCGIPSVALSLQYSPYGKHMYFSDAAKHSIRVIELVLREAEKNPVHCSRTIFNVNFPNVPEDEYRGWKITKQGYSIFRNSYELEKVDKDASGNVYRQSYALRGHLELNDPDNSFDTIAVTEKFISLTPLGLLHEHENQEESLTICANWKLDLPKC